ncbi:MAG: TetR family transcriptional regulator [Pseudonocardiaceae bacterium]|nr:TetR family transcriptional regulator [Pseudonocardiaceae bacterium]
MTTAKKTPRGPADPKRRDRIIAAVLDVMTTEGLIGTSHRAVARAAGVPLGSTTYYFDSLEDLLAGALEKLTDDYAEALRAWAGPLAGHDRRRLALAMTDLVVDYLSDDSGRIRVEYQLYLAAMDRPRLRPLAAQYTATTVDVLSTLVPHSTAVALSAVLDGFLIRGLVSPVPLDRAELEDAFAAICTHHD